MFETFFIFHYFSFFQTKRNNSSFCALSVPQLPADLDLEVEARGNGQGILEARSHFFPPFLIAVFPEIPKLKQFVNKDWQFLNGWMSWLSVSSTPNQQGCVLNAVSVLCCHFLSPTR